jgi:hypothetical protein
MAALYMLLKARLLYFLHPTLKGIDFCSKGDVEVNSNLIFKRFRLYWIAE